MNTQIAPPRQRRAYFECRYGQLHVHNAIPAGGGFDELTTLICLHGSSSTGRSFLPLSGILGMSRSVYSPDIPGSGESDGPPGPLPTAGFAEAIADFLDSMRFRQVDLLGVYTGAAIAAELAIARPKVVRRVAMIGAPASASWQAESRLPLLKLPLLVLRPKDDTWDAGARIPKFVPDVKLIDLPGEDKRVLEAAPALVAEHLSAFLGS